MNGVCVFSDRLIDLQTQTHTTWHGKHLFIYFRIFTCCKLCVFRELRSWRVYIDKDEIAFTLTERLSRRTVFQFSISRTINSLIQIYFVILKNIFKIYYIYVLFGLKVFNFVYTFWLKLIRRYKASVHFQESSSVIIFLRFIVKTRAVIRQNLVQATKFYSQI